MNKQQLAAIERVKRAMAKAERVGIAFAGTDACVRMFVRKEFEQVSQGSSPAEVLGILIQDYDSYPIVDTS